VVVDGTTLERSLALVAQALRLPVPVVVVVTMLDEMRQRSGALDIAALGRALGVPALAVTGHRGQGLEQLRALLADPASWPRPPLPPPTDAGELDAWITSVLAAADHRRSNPHEVTARVDAVLLHPVWGPLAFLAVMFVFFQTVFTLAAPLQDGVEAGFAWLATQVHEQVANPVLSAVLGDAVIGGVGAVLVFVPQIALLFLLLSLLESIGYLTRAAFLMDRLMSLTGLDGRAFVAMLSSVACAVPGIMATRTIPSPRDRIATILSAPLMTCSARLPVYVLLTGLLVEDRPRWGPISPAGLVLFALYLAGSLSAMLAARVLRTTVLRGGLLPFSMEMPPYRLPTPSTVLLAAWGSVRMFVRKAGTIILVTTLVLWALLNVPARTAQTAGMTPAQASAYVSEHSLAGHIGQAVEPVFAPLGFDWRIDLGLLGAMSAREVFVSTMGQIAAAADPANPREALAQLRYTDGPQAGEKVFTPPTVMALLVWFVYALQCTSTVAVMRRETNSWRWPALAFGYMFALAYLMALLARAVTAAVTG
jgi:ferrous iron transport protein B